MKHLKPFAPKSIQIFESNSKKDKLFYSIISDIKDILTELTDNGFFAHSDVGTYRKSFKKQEDILESITINIWKSKYLEEDKLFSLDEIMPTIMTIKSFLSEYILQIDACAQVNGEIAVLEAEKFASVFKDELFDRIGFIIY